MTRLARRWSLPILVAAVDCLVVFDVFALAYYLRFERQLAPSFAPAAPPVEYFKATVVVAYSWLLLFRVYGLYDFSRTRSTIDVVYLVLRAITVGTVLILALTYFYRDFTFSRLVCIYAWALAAAMFVGFRLALEAWRRDEHRRGRGRRRVLLVGGRTLAAFLAEKIRCRPELGYEVVGAIDDGRPLRGLGCPILGGLDSLESAIREHRVDRVFIAHPVLGQRDLLRTIRTCERLGVPLGMVPPTFDLVVNYRDFEEVDGVPLVKVNETGHHPVYHAAKRVLDATVAAAGIVVLAPIWLVLALLVKLEDGGPALFSQARVGKDGRVFRMIKFRTMVVNAEALLPQLVDISTLSEPVFKLDDDPRVTRIGRVLRRTSLDELPQLINVVLGDMSLVGPRPEEENVVRRYGVWEERRLKLKPGITGLQQVQCRGSKSLKERVRWDVLYLRKQSLLLDVWILVKTVLVVLGGKGAR